MEPEEADTTQDLLHDSVFRVSKQAGFQDADVMRSSSLGGTFTGKGHGIFYVLEWSQGCKHFVIIFQLYTCHLCHFQRKGREREQPKNQVLPKKFWQISTVGLGKKENKLNLEFSSFRYQVSLSKSPRRQNGT